MGKGWWVVCLGVEHKLDLNSRSNLKEKGLFLAQGFRGFRLVMVEKAWPWGKHSHGESMGTRKAWPRGKHSHRENMAWEYSLELFTW